MKWVYGVMMVIAFSANANALTVQEKLANIESSLGIQLGLSAIDTSNKQSIKYHANERFRMASTFKVMGVAAILKKSMTEPTLLKQHLTYTTEDVDLAWAPVTSQHPNGMSIEALSEAAIRYSDGTAINTLVRKLGGDKAVNAFARSIGDKTFTLQKHDSSTTPRAMEKSLQKLVLGDVLGAAQRELLQSWLKNNTTGDLRIRAGVPKGWVVADKTGSGDYGVANDVAVIWPPKCAPIVIAIYSARSKKDDTRQVAGLARATRIVLDAFSKHDHCLKKALIS